MTTNWTEASRALGAALADASLRAFCLAVVAAAIVWLARRRSASFRHAVWTVALAGMLLLPVLSALLPALPLRVLQPAPQQAVAFAPSAAPVVGAAPATAAVPAARPLWSWPLALAVAYAAVVLTLATRVLLGMIAVRRMVADALPIAELGPSKILLRLLNGEVPELLESTDVAAPVTIGWLRPRVVLPADWPEWEDAKLEAALAHEAAHVRRRDWLISLVAAANRCLFWFHPLAWYLERRVSVLAEQACDDAALVAVGDRERYAGVLLEMAHAVCERRCRMVGHAVAMARPSLVRHRIERILDDTRQLTVGLSRRTLVALALTSLTVLAALAAVQVVPRESQVNAGGFASDSPYLRSLVDSNALTPDAVDKLEQGLVSNPDDIATRGKLIAYYYQNSERTRRLGHVFWMIEHHPESDIALFASTGISTRSGPLNDEADFRRAYMLWKDQIDRHPNNARVLANAAAFVSRMDLDLAADTLKRAQKVDSGDARIADQLAGLYAMAIRAAALVPVPQAGEVSPAQMISFAEKAKSELIDSKDMKLVARVGGQLSNAARQWEQSRQYNRSMTPQPGLEAVSEFGKKLMERAASAGVQLGKPVAANEAVKLGDNGKEKKMIRKVNPVYPPEAKAARIEGRVVLRIVIGPDGLLSKAEAESGHPMLVPAAIDAVKQWAWEPTMLDGKAVSVGATVEINFRLNDSPGSYSASGASSSNASDPISVGGNMQSSKLVNRTSPVYPPLAKQARIQGTVRFAAIIDKEGKVANLQAISGHPLLVPSAMDAVRQWTYEPTLLNGQPVAVKTQIDVNYTLSDEPPPVQP